MEVLKERQSKEFCSSEFSANFKSLEAKSNHGKGIETPGLKRCLVDQNATVGGKCIKQGIGLGNQNHSTDLLALSPRNIMNCLIAQGDTYRESRHRRKVVSCRIGEAANPGPGLDNKQQKQFKLGDFFCKNHIQMDSKAEWCKALGLRIEKS
eukprot:10100958-Heterocapsa_arctica.AAC.1